MATLVRLPKVKGRIGLSVCGGAPYYRSVFIADVLLRSEADKCGKIWAGDEILSVNGNSVRGSGKAYVGRLIQESDDVVALEIRSWQLDKEIESKGLDIALKALKHKLVAKLPQDAVDILGICHAMLVNDTLAVQLNNLKRMAQFCKAFAHEVCAFTEEFGKAVAVNKDIAEVFGQLASTERQTDVSGAFLLVASKLRKIAACGEESICLCKQALQSVHTLLSKALPDTQLTVKKYADQKFEYLAYCLKTHEMEVNEEENFLEFEPWNPIYLIWETDYRDCVHLRHKRRKQFNNTRSGVFDKIKMLETKLEGDLPVHMETIARAQHSFYESAVELNQDIVDVFPITCTIEWGALTTHYMEQQMAQLGAEDGTPLDQSNGNDSNHHEHHDQNGDRHLLD